MDIEKVRQILDRMPVKSEYEFKHFEIEMQGSWHRQIRYALQRKEELHDMLEIAEASADLSRVSIDRVEKDYGKQERPHRKRILEAELAQNLRNVSTIRKQLEQVDKWLDGHKLEECTDAADSFEQSETENWTEQLGREVGVEVLANVKASKKSMMKLSMLPLADFKKAVLITNQFAGFLKKTTEQVEASLLPNRPAALPSDAIDKPAVPPVPSVATDSPAKPVIPDAAPVLASPDVVKAKKAR